ncbi:hypothetical protein [Kribbella sp.]|uniref:hypothetical protein n=1 Tax=Kribbella sp. TaxID=1871183 RepID=UPI002D27C13E|nr:hypothetical protein [Kribbella sp.]HZX05605.1 hypothetical protein [Kribbella sp.]
MVGRESLGVDLLRYLEESPGALVVFQNPSSQRRRAERPVPIQLAAWATGIAEELHAKYGEFVELQVGALSFPGKQLRFSEHVLDLPGEPAESIGLAVEALTPLTIRSGYHVKLDVQVTNRADRTQTLATAGDLVSAVTDSSGAVVGRYVGPHNAPRIEFPIDPQQSRPVPALIGTASLIPDLGYAVPPGQWSLVVSLVTPTGYYLSTPLGLTVTG